MARGDGNGKPGRPRKPIDQEMLLRFLQIFPTKAQTADFFNCSPDHIENEVERQFECGFSALRERVSFGKKRALLGWALQYAKRGDAHLIKFLMKNINKFHENPEEENDTSQVIELRYSIKKKNQNESDDNGQKQIAGSTNGDAGGESGEGE